MKEDYIKNTAIDPLTGEEFVPKRSNQKFASRENQIMFNNLKAAEERRAKEKTRRILNSNRKVLRTTLGSHNEVIRSHDYLLGAGLNFGFNTHRMKIDGINWICIDDHAYALIDKNTFKIKKLKG
ncbi:hypothetical protein [Winogradskyella sp. MIT101101]|uniref:hypothetical protein n=1 Tax=Winogradskyella sp. MIT101101 TaxID=3098297 RepID=UPI00399BBDF2